MDTAYCDTKIVQVSLLKGMKPTPVLNAEIDEADPSLVLSFYCHGFRLSNPKRVLYLKLFFRGIKNSYISHSQVYTHHTQALNTGMTLPIV